MEIFTLLVFLLGQHRFIIPFSLSSKMVTKSLVTVTLFVFLLNSIPLILTQRILYSLQCNF